MNTSALHGRRVLVTRAREDADRWASVLARLGAEPFVLPCLVTEPIDDAETAGALREALTVATWLVVTSARGVDAVAHLLAAPLPRHTRVAAVGPATARAATAQLGRVDLVSSGSTSGSLGAELASLLCETPGAGRCVLVAGAAGGRQDAERELAAAGIPTRRVDVYRTVPVAPSALKRELAADGVDDVLLASPSAVTGLVNCAVLPAEARVFTIGPTTSAAARAAGLSVTAEARSPNLDGMLEAMS
ncbi:MAG: uroporphyrinogen-III synthase [Gemmatimonadales bacterium]